MYLNTLPLQHGYPYYSTSIISASALRIESSYPRTFSSIGSQLFNLYCLSYAYIFQCHIFLLITYRNAPDYTSSLAREPCRGSLLSNAYRDGCHPTLMYILLAISLPTAILEPLMLTIIPSPDLETTMTFAPT